MEIGKPVEIAQDAIKVAYNIGKFTMDRLVGGHWGTVASEVQAASIQVYESNIERGAE
jgi:hypothetical protein